MVSELLYIYVLFSSMGVVVSKTGGVVKNEWWVSKTSGGCQKRVVGVENEWCMLKKGGVVLKTGVVWLKMSGVVENRWGGCRKQVVWC